MDNFLKNPTSSDPDRRRRLRRLFYLSLIPAVIAAGRTAHSDDVVVATESGDAWTIAIQPQHKVELVAYQADASPPPEAAAPESELFPAPAEVTEPVIEEHGVAVVPNAKSRVGGLTYRQVYHSIPFSRSEYLANPAYRHDATMELLTGIPRQSVHSSYQSKLNGPTPSTPVFLHNRYGTFGGTFGAGGYGGVGGFGGLGGGYHGLFYIPQYAPAFRYFLPMDYGY